MDIILDSNIFRSDISLRSKEFDVIIDYLKKTESSIVLPQIILDEIKGLYVRTINERIIELNKNINNVNLLLPDNKKHISTIKIDTLREVENYEIFIKKTLGISPYKIIPYNNNYLPIISTRAISRVKPAGEKGQGFRDTLIWLTMKDYCLTCHEKQITFISINTEDFATADKSSLHESLKAECDEIKIKINYFKSVKDFIENQSIKIDFITHDWIAENLDYESVGDIVKSYLNSEERRSIISWIQSETGELCLGYKALSFEPFSDDNLSVYEMSDNRLIVNLTIEGTVDFEFDIRVRHWNYEYDYQDHTINKYLNVLASISLTLVNNEIFDIEMLDFGI